MVVKYFWKSKSFSSRLMTKKNTKLIYAHTSRMTILIILIYHYLLNSSMINNGITNDVIRTYFWD